jgi:hypothetical protein
MAAHANLIVQVRRGDTAGGASGGDDLAAADFLTREHLEA